MARLDSAFIWRHSGINQRIASGDIPTVNGWFLGDSGYPLRLNLLTPIISQATPSDVIIKRSRKHEKLLSVLSGCGRVQMGINE